MIFETQPKSYYWDNSYDFCFAPIDTLNKLTLGNIHTLIENFKIKEKNYYTIESLIKRKIAPLFGKKVIIEKPKSPLQLVLQSKIIREIAIGILIFCISIPFFLLLDSSLTRYLIKRGINIQDVQDVKIILEIPKRLPLPLRAPVLTYLYSYVSFFGPIYEETFFREKIYSWIKEQQEGSNTTVAKITRITLNGIAFGACHLSPFQGWFNIPIFVLTTFMGIIFVSLREWRGSITACTSAHIANNMLALMEHIK